MANAQVELLTDPRLLASSASVLRKINFLLLSPKFDARSTSLMLSPFTQLTKLSVVALSTYCEPVFPVSVVKVAIHAATPNQRFNSNMVSNLTELWRLSIYGFYSVDLTTMPAVRPGFVLKIVDIPSSRKEPLGHQGLDVLMAPGNLVDMALQLGTDQSVEVCVMGPARVNLASWAPLVRDIHVRCPAGAELYTGKRSVAEFFRELSASGIEQFAVCIAPDASGNIIEGPQDSVNPGQAPTFAFVMSNGTRLHGMSVAMLIKHGAVPGWNLEVMDAHSSVEDEEGVVYFTFWRNPSSKSASAGGAPTSHPVPPASPGGPSLLEDLD